jgi:hypothetical protein
VYGEGETYYNGSTNLLYYCYYYLLLQRLLLTYTTATTTDFLDLHAEEQVGRRQPRVRGEGARAKLHDGDRGDKEE